MGKHNKGARRRNSSDENVEKNKKSNGKKVAIISAVAIVGVLGVSINYFNKNYIYTDTIAKNIFIENTNVSNLTKEEAIKYVNENVSPSDIELKYNGETNIISPQDIELKYNISEVVDEAYNYTKTDSYFENVKRFFELNKNSKNLELKSLYNETKLTEKIQSISELINVEMENAKVFISNSGNISVSSATIGKELDITATKESIYDAIKAKDYSPIDLKVDTKEPKVSNEAANSVNALLGQFSTKFSTNDSNRVTNVVLSATIDLKVDTKEPKVSNEAANSVNALLGQFSTKFSTNDSNRVTNVVLSARSTSDVLLMPGEEFSYNTLTGTRTKSNGYKDAPVIVNGKLEQDVGGGVCQVSSTLFNSVLYSGLDVTSRRNHSLKSSYVSIGRDAMVSDGGSDFRFKNPYSHPVYIKNIVSNGVITSRIYGNAADKKNITIKVDPYTTGGLEAAKTYIQYKDSSGKVISTKYISNSVYKKPKN